MKISLKKIISLSVILALAFVLYPIHPPVVYAVGDLSDVTDVLSRLKATQASVTHTFQFTIVAALDQTSKIQFVTDDFALVGTPVVKDDTSSVGSPSVDAEIVTIGGTCTIDTGSVVEITGLTSTNPAAGDYTITINTDPNGDGNYSDGDTGSVIIHIIADDTVVTTATVLPTLSFAIQGDLSMEFGTIATDASRWATTTGGSSGTATAHTLTASTNSTSGYTITVRGATLTSVAESGHTITAIDPKVALDTGTVEQFGLNIVAAGGTGITVDTDYDNITPSADHYYYGGTASTADSIAVCEGLSGETTYTIRYAANISGSTEAHTDYTASLIYVATGNF